MLKNLTRLYTTERFAPCCHAGAVVLPLTGTSLGALPKARGCAASSDAGGS